MKIKIAFLLLLFCKPLLAQETPQVLLPNSQIAGMQFGRTVQFCKDKLLVGSTNTSPDAMTGKVHIFEQSGTVFKETGQIELPNSQEKRFGWQISTNDTQILVSAYTENTTANWAGMVYVYNNTNDGYKIQQKIKPQDAQEQHWFGFRTTLNATTALITALHDNDMGYQCGAVYVYAHNNSKWEEKQKLTPPYTCNNAAFGNAIALCNNAAFVGAPRTNTTQAPNGAVYYYHYNGKNWEIKQTLVPTDNNNSLFGWAIALQDNMLVISAPIDSSTQKNNGGSVYVFKQENDKWTMVQKIVSPDNTFAYFGAALTLHNNQLWITDGNHAVYQYHYHNNQWQLHQTLLPEQPTNAYGSSIATNGNYLAIADYTYAYQEIENLGSIVVLPIEPPNNKNTSTEEPNLVNLIDNTTTNNTPKVAPETLPTTTIDHIVISTLPNIPTQPANTETNIPAATKLPAATTFVTIYPNPNEQGIFYITTTEPLPTATKIQLYDAAGHSVPINTDYTSSTKISITIPNAKAGNYFLHLTTPNTNTVQTITVIK